MDYFVTVKGSVLPVSVSLKKMKQVRLKVFPSGEIKLSVPTGTPEEWIAEYLNDKAGWIEEKLEFFIQTRAIEKEKHFVSGSYLRQTTYNPSLSGAAQTNYKGRQRPQCLHTRNRSTNYRQASEQLVAKNIKGVFSRCS